MMAKIWDLALDIPSISPEEPPSSTALVWAARWCFWPSYSQLCSFAGTDENKEGTV